MNKKLVAYIAVEIRDKNGQLKHFEKKEANSLVKGFLNQLYSSMAYADLAGCVDTSGTVFTLNHVGSIHGNMTALDNNDTMGIVVGSGTTPVTVSDTKLQSKILTGDVSGKLHYLVQAFTSPATTGQTHSFTATRGFVNNSGASITVNEVGIYANNNSGNIFMSDHTLMTFSIASGATGTVTYTIQISV